jgi:hypothetical protein
MPPTFFCVGAAERALMGNKYSVLYTVALMMACDITDSSSKGR